MTAFYALDRDNEVSGADRDMLSNRFFSAAKLPPSAVIKVISTPARFEVPPNGRLPFVRLGRRAVIRQIKIRRLNRR